MKPVPAGQPGGRTDPAPALNRSAIVDLYRRHVSAGWAKLAEFMALPLEVRSSGTRVYDEQGEPYLDCGGYGVFIVGHCHPAIVHAVKAQLERHPLATRLLLNPELAKAAQMLAAVAPPGLQHVCFTNSGTEATELGLKLARLNGKRRVVATRGGFHGKTLGALSVTGHPGYQKPFEPLLPGVRFVPFGDPDELRRAVARGVGACCVIMEPVQGEGGVVVPPPGYLRAVREICTKNDALLILDEIQTGLGRLGAWWGADREGVVPDVLLVGKGLSGGAVPVGATLASPAAYAALNRDPFLHTSTFAGNPLAMAAAQAAIRVIQEEGLVARANELGARLLGALRGVLADACPDLVVDVRGVGLLIGIEFAAEALAGEFMLELLRRRVIASHALNAHRVVRLTPPAVLTDEDCNWLLGAVHEASAALRQRQTSGLGQ